MSTDAGSGETGEAPDSQDPAGSGSESPEEGVAAEQDAADAVTGHGQQ